MADRITRGYWDWSENNSSANTDFAWYQIYCRRYSMFLQIGTRFCLPKYNLYLGLNYTLLARTPQRQFDKICLPSRTSRYCRCAYNIVWRIYVVNEETLYVSLVFYVDRGFITATMSMCTWNPSVDVRCSNSLKGRCGTCLWWAFNGKHGVRLCIANSGRHYWMLDAGILCHFKGKLQSQHNDLIAYQMQGTCMRWDID